MVIGHITALDGLGIDYSSTTPEQLVKYYDVSGIPDTQPERPSDISNYTWETATDIYSILQELKNADSTTRYYPAIIYEKLLQKNRERYFREEGKQKNNFLDRSVGYWAEAFGAIKNGSPAEVRLTEMPDLRDFIFTIEAFQTRHSSRLQKSHSVSDLVNNPTKTRLLWEASRNWRKTRESRVTKATDESDTKEHVVQSQPTVIFERDLPEILETSNEYLVHAILENGGLLKTIADENNEGKIQIFPKGTKEYRENNNAEITARLAASSTLPYPIKRLYLQHKDAFLVEKGAATFYLHGQGSKFSESNRWNWNKLLVTLKPQIDVVTQEQLTILESTMQIQDLQEATSSAVAIVDAQNQLKRQKANEIADSFFTEIAGKNKIGRKKRAALGWEKLLPVFDRVTERELPFYQSIRGVYDISQDELKDMVYEALYQLIIVINNK